MAVLLVLATFLVFLVIDWALNRKKAIPSTRSRPPHAPRRCSVQHLSRVSLFPISFATTLATPGVSENGRSSSASVRSALAASVCGPVNQRSNLPKIGRWLRQGQKGWSVVCGSERIDMLSPVEGEVVEVNPEVVNNPELLTKDPYGKGWLVR